MNSVVALIVSEHWYFTPRLPTALMISVSCSKLSNENSLMEQKQRESRPRQRDQGIGWEKMMPAGHCQCNTQCASLSLKVRWVPITNLENDWLGPKSKRGTHLIQTWDIRPDQNQVDFKYVPRARVHRAGMVQFCTTRSHEGVHIGHRIVSLFLLFLLFS